MKKILKIINDYSGFFGIVITIITLFANFIFYLCSYFYKVGKGAYFNIDENFYNIELEVNFTIVLAVGFWWLIVALVSYNTYKSNFIEKNNKFRSILMTNIFIILIVLMTGNISFGKLIACFVIAIFIWGGINMLGKGIYQMINEENQSLYIKGLIYLLFILPIIFFINGYLGAKNKTDFEYITFESQQYVIVDINNDYYYTYPCEIEGTNLILNSNSRRIFKINEVLTTDGIFDVSIK